jgi:23S rRNA (pseudouridine1915-N3)-methyltransferase
MKIELVLVGKTNPQWLVAGIEEYRQRLVHYADFGFRIVQASGNLPPNQAVEKEGKAILDKLTGKDWVVVLDEKGKEMDTIGFSKLLEKQMNQGTSSMVFIIGGAFGVSQEVRHRANLMLSFSQFTMTHQMIRLVLVEQLYRAMTVIEGKAYHHV